MPDGGEVAGGGAGEGGTGGDERGAPFPPHFDARSSTCVDLPAETEDDEKGDEEEQEEEEDAGGGGGDDDEEGDEEEQEDANKRRPRDAAIVPCAQRHG